MKTKFYLTLGLLAATLTSSFAQEIVSEFSPKPTSHYSDVVETSDGMLLIGSCPNPYTHQYTVYKATTDGIFLDSTVFSSEYQLLEIPSVADTFLLVGFSHSYSDNIYKLKLTLIDSELSTIRESLIPIGERTYHFWDYSAFITPNREIIFPYSIGIGDVLHIIRIGFDFTMIEDKAFPNIPRGTWDYENTSDSVVFYTKINVFSNSPLSYHCLGFHEEANGNTVFINYILDGDFNFSSSNNIRPYDENTVFTDEMLTTINEVENDFHSKYHLMATSLGFDNDTSAAIIKFNDKNLPEAMYRFTGNYRSAGVGQMVVKDYNTIYFTHSCIDYRKPIRVVRLNGDLELAWELPITCTPVTISMLNTLKVLRNGNILVGAILYHNYDDPYLRIYIIDENLNGTHDLATVETRFKVYPNPVKDVLHISFEENNKPESIELYDLMGKKVVTERSDLESIDMSRLSPGIYLICANFNDGEKRYEKVVKE